MGGKDKPEFSSGWSRGAHTQHLDPQVTTRRQQRHPRHIGDTHTHNIKHGIIYQNIPRVISISSLAVLAIMTVGLVSFKAYFNQIAERDHIKTTLYPVCSWTCRYFQLNTPTLCRCAFFELLNFPRKKQTDVRILCVYRYISAEHSLFVKTVIS